MICSSCGRLVHLDFSTRDRRCNGCESTPLLCQCRRIVEPEWVRRARTNALPRKDYTGAAA